MTKATPSPEQSDFSLVRGGPLFQLFRRARLSGDALELPHRRVVAICVIAWLPLLLLSAFVGQALDTASGIPFLHDIEAHARFLIALPILIAAEGYVHSSLRPLVDQFVERGIVVPEDIPRFRDATAATLAARNSVAAEVVILVLVYTLGLWITQSQIVLGTASWFAIPDGEGMRLTPAGYWCFFVSMPVFQFILLRWYMRFLLWFWFLWRVSRLNLRVVHVHPDRAGGLGFLAWTTQAFVPLLLAQGVLLAGLIADRIFYAGQDLMAFKAQVAGFVVIFTAITLSPLAMFAPHLARAQRQGINDFGVLASRYAGAFDEKWLQGAKRGDAELLGSGDIQSLADLGSGHAIVDGMRVVPFGVRDAARVAAATALPLLPLTLTMFSLQEVVTRLIKVLL